MRLIGIISTLSRTKIMWNKKKWYTIFFLQYSAKLYLGPIIMIFHIFAKITILLGAYVFPNVFHQIPHKISLGSQNSCIQWWKTIQIILGILDCYFTLYLSLFVSFLIVHLFRPNIIYVFNIVMIKSIISKNSRRLDRLAPKRL